MQILEEGAVPPDEVILETQEVTADNAQAIMDSFTGGGASTTEGTTAGTEADAPATTG